MVIKFPLNVSTLPLKAGSLEFPVAIPDTVAISADNVFPVEIKLLLKVEMSESFDVI